MNLKDKVLKLDLKLELKHEIGGNEFIHYQDLTESCYPALFTAICDAVNTQLLNDELPDKSWDSLMNHVCRIEEMGYTVKIDYIGEDFSHFIEILNTDEDPLQITCHVAHSLEASKRDLLYNAIVDFYAWKNGSIKNVDNYKDRLTRLVWDGLLTANYQDENWHDEDTCRLIVEKIMNNGKIEHATGDIPK